jgi:hypothetical protein
MIRIYQILDLTNGNCYIGSSRQKYLSKRISRHRDKSNTCYSKYIIENGNYKVNILEMFEDVTIRKERERFWINNVENCINKNKLNGLDKEKQKKRYQYNKVCKELYNINI